MKNRYFIIELVLALLILLLIIIFPIGKKYTDVHAENSKIVYIVKPNDTLWSISKQYVKGDPRQFIYSIKKANNIGPDIYPGQELIIPDK
jgi:LysM repeat protein